MLQGGGKDTIQSKGRVRTTNGRRNKDCNDIDGGTIQDLNIDDDPNV